jgi:hypothetical protein
MVENRSRFLLQPRILMSSRLLEYDVWSRIWACGIGQSHREEVRASLAKIGMTELARLSLHRALEPFPVGVGPSTRSTWRQGISSATAANLCSLQVTTIV